MSFSTLFPYLCQYCVRHQSFRWWVCDRCGRVLTLPTPPQSPPLWVREGSLCRGVTWAGSVRVAGCLWAWWRWRWRDGIKGFPVPRVCGVCWASWPSTAAVIDMHTPPGVCVSRPFTVYWKTWINRVCRWYQFSSSVGSHWTAVAENKLNCLGI